MTTLLDFRLPTRFWGWSIQPTRTIDIPASSPNAGPSGVPTSTTKVEEKCVRIVAKVQEKCVSIVAKVCAQGGVVHINLSKI